MIPHAAKPITVGVKKDMNKLWIMYITVRAIKMKQYKTTDATQMKAYMATFKGAMDEIDVPFGTLQNLMYGMKW